MESDLIYYRRRAAEETAAAVAVQNMKVKQVHLELARRYSVRVTDLEAEPTRERLRLISAA
jgi:hypothetical protein